LEGEKSRGGGEIEDNKKGVQLETKLALIYAGFGGGEKPGTKPLHGACPNAKEKLIFIIKTGYEKAH